MMEGSKLRTQLPVLLSLGVSFCFIRILMAVEMEGYNTKMAVVTGGVMMGITLLTALYCSVKRFYIQAMIGAVSILFAVGGAYQSLFGSTGYLFHSLLSFGAMVMGFCLIRNKSEFSDLEYRVLTGCIFALILLNMLFGGSTRDDTDSALWISIGSFTFQPGELIRVLLILQGSMSYRKKKRVIIYSLSSMVAAGFLMCAHDFGGGALILVLYLVMVYELLDNRILTLGLIISGLGFFFLLMKVNPYTMERLLATGQALATGEVTQQGRIIKAVYFAGVGGMGLSGSDYVTSIYSAGSDLALAGVQAVFGLPVLMITMMAYALMILQVGTNQSVYPSGHLIPMQLGIMTGVQVLLNYCGSLDLLPFTGITAPLISRGGSSMLTFGLLIGMACGSLCPNLRQRNIKYHCSLRLFRKEISLC